MDYVPQSTKMERQFGMGKWRASQKALRRDKEIRASVTGRNSYRTDNRNVPENATGDLTQNGSNNITPKSILSKSKVSQGSTQKATLDRSVSTMG